MNNKKRPIKGVGFSHRWAAAAWCMGVMLNPDNLVITGNGAGYLGGSFAFAVLLAIGCFLLNGMAYSRLLHMGEGRAAEAEGLERAFATPWMRYWPFLVRIPIALFAATGALVSAGFVFNETFLHWFPNFAFAYLLLGIVSGASLLGPKSGERLQLILWGVALSGLVCLMVLGFLSSKNPSTTPYPQFSTDILPFYLLPLFLMVGFDLLHINTRTATAAPLTRVMIGGVLTGGLLHSLWGWVSILHVPHEKLIGTSIPHIVAARAIGGDTGRFIMGIVIIFGTGAMINTLFTGIANLTGELLSKGDNPGVGGRPDTWRRGTVAGLTAATSAMMAGGLAGSDLLEIHIQGGFLLVLLYYGLLHISVLVMAAKGEWRQMGTLFPGNTAHWIGAGAMIGAAGLFVITSEAPYQLLRFLSAAVILMFVAGWLMSMRRKRDRIVP